MARKRSRRGGMKCIHTDTCIRNLNLINTNIETFIDKHTHARVHAHVKHMRTYRHTLIRVIRVNNRTHINP